MKNIKVIFHLTSGQSVTVKLVMKEGETVTEADLRELVNWKDMGDLFLIQNNEWAISIPDMKNVALIEFIPTIF